MSDIFTLAKARPDVQEQVKRLRNALDASKKTSSPLKATESREDQVEKIKAYLERMNQVLDRHEKSTPSLRPVVIGESINQFNDSLSPSRIENIFADALLVTAEEVKNFELPPVKPIIAANVEKFDSAPAKPVVAVEFSEREYNQFARMLVENFALFAKEHPQKEQNLAKETLTSLDRYPVVGKYTQKIIESRQPTQRFVSEVDRPIPSGFSDWFGGPGFTISSQMREEFSEYLHGKSTQPQAVTRLKEDNKKDRSELPRSVNQSMSHLLQRTKASQEKIINKRSFVELLELLNSVRINGHNNGGFGSGRS